MSLSPTEPGGAPACSTARSQPLAGDLPASVSGAQSAVTVAGANVAGANVSGAQSAVTVAGANVAGANVAGAQSAVNVARANVAGANVVGANVSGAQSAARHVARQDEDAAAVVTVLAALAASAATSVGPPDSSRPSLWGMPARAIARADLPPGPASWWASGLPR